MAAKPLFHRMDNAARFRRVENTVKFLLVVLLVGVGVIGGREWAARRAIGDEQVPITVADLPGKVFATAVEAKAGIQAAVAAEDWDEVVALTSRAMEAVDDATDQAEIWNACGLAEMQRGHHPEAVACFLKAIKLQADQADYYSHWAEALRAAGQSEAALAPMRKAVALDPESLPLKVKWVLLLIEAGRGPEIAKAIDAETVAGKSVSLEFAFAKIALLRAEHQSVEAEALLKKLEAKLPPEIFRACVNDPMLVMSPALGEEAQGALHPQH